MKKVVIALILICLFAGTAWAENTDEKQRIYLCVAQQYPGVADQVEIDWQGDTAAAALIANGRRILCMLNRYEDEWYIALKNEIALIQDAELPLLQLEEGMFSWTYQMGEAIVTFTSHRDLDGGWDIVSETIKTPQPNDTYALDQIWWNGTDIGKIQRVRQLFDNGNNLIGTGLYEIIPATWMSARTLVLSRFDVSTFPVGTDDGWPGEGFLRRTAATLLPNDAYVTGDCVDGSLRFLVQNVQGALQIVGCAIDGGQVSITRSTTLPTGAIYDAAEHALIYNGQEVSFQRFGNTLDWGISAITGSTENLFFGKYCLGSANNPETLYIGSHPWSTLQADWDTLPRRLRDAVDRVNSQGWAAVNNPNPKDTLYLREKANKDGAFIGQYYNGTPVRILQEKGDWVRVDIFGQTGWMMARYLDFTEPCRISLAYLPAKTFYNGSATLYDSPSASASSKPLYSADGLRVLGVTANGFYHVWFPRSNVHGFIRQEEMW